MIYETFKQNNLSSLNNSINKSNLISPKLTKQAIQPNSSMY